MANYKIAFKNSVAKDLRYRSSRLNKQYRVIYQTKANEVYVQVEEVTPHDYRRK